MAGGMRKLGAAFVELFADKTRLKSDLDAAREAVKQYSQKVEQLQDEVAAHAMAAQQKEFAAFTSTIDAKIAKLKAARDAENAPDDSAAYQAKLQGYAVEAEMQRRAVAAEKEMAEAAAARVPIVAAEAAQAQTLAQGLRSATAGARALRTAILGVVGIIGSVVAVVGLLVAGFIKVKDSIFGSKAELEAFNSRLQESEKRAESVNEKIREQIRLQASARDESAPDIVSEDSAKAAKARLVEIGAEAKALEDTIKKNKTYLEMPISNSAGKAAAQRAIQQAEEELTKLEYERERIRAEIRQRAQTEAEQDSKAEQDRIAKETKERIAGILAASKAKRDAASDRTYEQMLSEGLINLYRQQMLQAMNEDSELFRQKQALEAILHDLKTAHANQEHEQAMRLQEEFYRSIRAQFTGLGGLRRLADLPGIIERMSRSV